MLNNTKKITVIFAISGLWLCLFGTLRAEAFLLPNKINLGNKAFRQGDYDESIKHYEESLKTSPESDVGNFNLGTAYYKKGEFSKALEFLQKSLLTENKGLKSKAHYNLGDAMYGLGKQQEDQDIDKAIGSLQGASGHFQEALSLDPQDIDAQHNYDFIKKELERLKKKKKELESKKEDQNKNNEQKQEDNQDKQKKEQEKLNNQSDKDKQGNPQQKNENQPNPGQNQQDQLPSAGKERPDQGDSGNRGKEGSDGSKERLGSQQEEPNSLGRTEGSDKELTQKEAKMMLDHYQQNQEPKGLFTILKQNQKQEPVLKDW